MRGHWIAVALLVLAAAACAPPGALAGTTGHPAANASPSVAGTRDGRAWAACMRRNGIPVPDPDPATGQLPGFDKGAQDRTRFEQAVQACAALEPVSRRDTSPLTPAELEQKRQWAVCMRQQGVAVPDPDPNDPNGPHFERLPNLPPAAVIDRALAACRTLLPARERPPA